MKKSLTLSLNICVLVSCMLCLFGWSSPASALTVLTTVGANEGPWQWVNGGLNTAYPYDFGAEQPPTVISASQGFNFSAGLSLTVSYVSGSVRIGDTQWPFVDANGVPGANPLGYGLTPANYMDPALGPYSMSELVGTFANSSGSIVGTPFAIGDLGTFTIPTGATQLQLGVMDLAYGDNLGSWTIQVSQVPEPATWSLLALGAVVLIGSRRLRSSL